MIKIVTDSSCYLSPDFVLAQDIEIVPLKIHFGYEVYDEVKTMSNEAFYGRLTTGNMIPTTSQPSIGDFQAAYQKKIREGADQLLVITLSSKLSGTYNAAQAAADTISTVPITVFDSYSLGLGFGLMIATASDMIEMGEFMPKILNRLFEMRVKMRIFFVLDTLEYVRKGGRIGATAAFFGGLLKLKPILTIEDGLVKPLDKVRTKRKAITRLLEEVQMEFPNRDQPVQLAAMHADAPIELEPLAEQLKAMFNHPCRFMTGEIGAVLGAHAGPGTLGIGICPEC